MQFFLTFAALSSLVSAIMVTQPSLNQVVPNNGTVQVSWTSVDTDPSIVSIVLSNGGSQSAPLQNNVPTSSNGFTADASQFVPGSYQINLVNAQTGGIFAQSPKFQVVEGIKLASVVTSAVASSTQSIQGTSSSAAVAVATPVQNSLVGSGGLTNSASAAAADSSVLSSSISAASTISSASQLATGGVLASASGAVAVSGVAAAVTGAASVVSAAASGAAAVKSSGGVNTVVSTLSLGLVAMVAGLVL